LDTDIHPSLKNPGKTRRQEAIVAHPGAYYNGAWQPAILHLPVGKGKDTYGIQDTIEIFQGSCQGIKGPPYGGPFFPCHPPEAFLVSLRWSVTERITDSSRKERKKSGKLRIICLKWRIAGSNSGQGHLLSSSEKLSSLEEFLTTRSNRTCGSQSNKFLFSTPFFLFFIRLFRLIRLRGKYSSLSPLFPPIPDGPRAGCPPASRPG
jgi:hypothetical protein